VFFFVRRQCRTTRNRFHGRIPRASRHCCLATDRLSNARGFRNISIRFRVWHTNTLVDTGTRAGRGRYFTRNENDGENYLPKLLRSLNDFRSPADSVHAVSRRWSSPPPVHSVHSGRSLARWTFYTSRSRSVSFIFSKCWPAYPSECCSFQPEGVCSSCPSVVAGDSECRPRVRSTVRVVHCVSAKTISPKPYAHDTRTAWRPRAAIGLIRPYDVGTCVRSSRVHSDV